MTGDVSATERRWTIRGEAGLRRGRVFAGPDVIEVDSIDVIDVASYDRVVAERDEARKQARNLGFDRDEHLARADRYREAARALARIATGEVGHDFMGRCPSDPDDDIRDPGCPACRVLSEWDETRAALAEGEQPAGETRAQWEGRVLRAAAEQVRDILALADGETHKTTAECCGGEDACVLCWASHLISEALEGRRAAIDRLPAAGVQSTTETTADDEGHRLECLSLIGEIEGWSYGSYGQRPGHHDVSHVTAARIVAALRRAPYYPSTTETATGEILVPLDLLSLALLDDGDHVPDDPVYGRLCAEGLCTWNDRDEGWDLTPSGRREITLALGSAAPATPEGPDARG